MTIRRISRIARYRIYEDWRNRTANDFGRVNVVYGANGSGKSTLAQLFQDCIDQIAPTATGLKLDLVGEPATANQGSSDFWRRVHVFNGDYVSRNLKFEAAEGTTAESLLVLGEENVKADVELKATEKEIERLDDLSRNSRQTADRVTRELDNLLKSIASGIVAELSKAGGVYRSGHAYTRSVVRALLEGDRSIRDEGSSDVAADLLLATSENRPSRAVVARADVVADMAPVRALLTKRVTTAAIPELAEGQVRGNWVQEGMTLHRQGDTCLFCANEISPERWNALERHFDASLKSLQREIDSCIATLLESRDRVDAHIRTLPGAGDVHVVLAEEYGTALTAYRDAQSAFSSQVERAVEQLQAKRSNPFATIELSSDATLEIPDKGAVERLVADHNQQSATFDADRSTAARRIEISRVFEQAELFDQLESDLAAATKRAEESETGLAEVRTRVQSLTSRLADPTPLAAELTTSLTRLLGRDELSFETTGDGSHYRLLRSGEPADGLSEGERSAVALLHFLARLKSAAVEANNPIVVIDDPVSSLDQDILFGMSAHLWSELVPIASGIAQTFVFTHSFELFRQWVYQLQHTPEPYIGSHSIHELRIATREGLNGAIRVPQFEPWPADVKLSSRMRSQYHFLFAKVADALLATNSAADLYTKLDLLALAPNAARKMLEAFLSFRYPNQMGDFHGSLRRALQKVPGSAPYRTRVERYLHAYSHDEQGDISDPLLPGEAPSVIASVFELIRELDPEHFSAMCESLQIDTTSLLGAR